MSSFTSVPAVLEWAATNKPDGGVRFIDRRGDTSFYTFSNLHRASLDAATGLQAAGIEPGDHVALILGTGLDFYTSFFGCMLAGAVPVPIYPPAHLGRLDEYHERTSAMLRVSDAKAVVASPGIRRILGRTLAGAPGVRSLVASELRGTGGTFTPVDLSLEDAALIQLSSGTTGASKPVLLTHEQLVNNVTMIAGFIDEFVPAPEGGHQVVSWLPLYHDMGLIGALLCATVVAQNITLMTPERFVTHPASWLQAVTQYRASISVAPNFAYALCAKKVTDDELAGLDLSSWCFALNGAEPVVPSAIEAFATRFAPVGFRRDALCPSYGLAEATLAVTLARPGQTNQAQRFDPDALTEHGEARLSDTSDALPLTSSGSPIGGVKVEIRDPSGRPLGDGRLGRIFVQSPSLMREYYGNRAATDEALSDAWLNTGDEGFLLNNELYIHGRAKDLIIIRGRNYAPQLFEQAADTVPGVRVGCAAAAPMTVDDAEQVMLFVEKASDATVADDALAEAVKREVQAATGVVPYGVHVLAPGTLARTSSGKIRRAETLKRFLAESLHAPGKSSMMAYAKEVVRSTFARPQ